jgi:ferredoxin
VDFDTCSENAMCMDTCPDMFDAGRRPSRQDDPGEELRVNVRDTERSCPTRAITVQD